MPSIIQKKLAILRVQKLERYKQLSKTLIKNGRKIYQLQKGAEHFMCQHLCYDELDIPEKFFIFFEIVGQKYKQI